MVCILNKRANQNYLLPILSYLKVTKQPTKQPTNQSGSHLKQRFHNNHQLAATPFHAIP